MILEDQAALDAALREAKSAYNIAYHRANKVRLREKRRIWYAANKERLKLIRAENYDSLKEAERAKSKHLANPEKRSAYHLKWRETAEGRAYSIWSARKRDAKKARLEFTLPLETVVLALQLGTCEATGLLFNMKAGRGKAGPFSPSIDRKDSTKGYTPENSRMVLWALNAACGKWGEEVLWKIVAARWPSRIRPVWYGG
jgi:hypothetical protein